MRGPADKGREFDRHIIPECEVVAEGAIGFDLLGGIADNFQRIDRREMTEVERRDDQVLEPLAFFESDIDNPLAESLPKVLQ